MGRILAVRLFEAQPRSEMAELLDIAEHRLKAWGAWEAQGNSLRDLQYKCQLRPRRALVEVPAENPDAEQVGAALRAHMAMDSFAVLIGVYVRRMTQHEAARRAEVSRDRVARIIRKGRLVVVAECL